MDGDQMANVAAESLNPKPARLERGDRGGTAAARPKVVRWFVIVGLLLVVLLGGLYQFNRFRSQAIANFFAHNKPPPAQISAAEVKVQTLPRYAPGIGSLVAVHQVTINPEVAGRVTQIFFEPGTRVKAGDPLVQLNDAPDRGDLANYQAQAHLAQISLQRSQSLRKNDFASQETVDQNQSQLDQMDAMIQKDRGDHRPKADPGAVLRPARRAPDRSRSVPDGRGTDRHVDRSVDLVRQFHAGVASAAGDLGRAAGQRHRRRLPRPRVQRKDHDDRAADQPRHADDGGPGDDEQPGQRAVAGHVRRCRGRAAVAPRYDRRCPRPRSNTRSTATASM